MFASSQPKIMLSRKTFLWDQTEGIPQRTRFRKKQKLCNDAHESNTNETFNDELSSESEHYSCDNDNENIPSDPEFKNNISDLLYEDSHLTLKNSLLLIMSFCLKFHLTNEALDSLLQLLCLHMPESLNFPKTKYLFFQHFEEFKELAKVYVSCPKCSFFSTESFKFSGNLNKHFVCDNCSEQCDYNLCVSTGKHFLTFDIARQIRKILEDPCVQEYLWCGNSVNDTSYSDITSGEMYKNLKKTDSDITLSFNTDGVPLFNSSKCSFWPLQIVINELPIS